MACSVHFTKDDSTVSWELPHLLLRGECCGWSLRDMVQAQVMQCENRDIRDPLCSALGHATMQRLLFQSVTLFCRDSMGRAGTEVFW